LEQGSQLYIIDIVEDLKFIDEKVLSGYFDSIDKILLERGISLIIETSTIN
jgi:hypothetical protein